MNDAVNKHLLTCITCPIGCSLVVEQAADGITVSGNRCARGAVYAREEFLAPKRVVSATCAVREPAADSLYAPRRVPVRTERAFPRERIDELLQCIYACTVDMPVKRGHVLIENALDTGINVIVTRDI